MNLSKSSLIYRSYRYQWFLTNEYWRNFNPSNNACQFLRRYVGRCLFTFFLGFTMSISALAALSTAFVLLFGNFQAMAPIAFFQAGMMFLIIIGFSTGVVLFILGANALIGWLLRLRGDEPREPGLISEYIRGVKNKYCPHITFTE